jgi:hypothetical protein
VSSFRLWFGVLGAPLAWTVQHVAGLALTLADCGAAGTVWNVPVSLLTAIVTAAAVLAATLAELSAIQVFRATRGAGDAEPPASRIHFLSIVGLAIGPLFVAMMLMSGLSSILLTKCLQG